MCGPALIAMARPETEGLRPAVDDTSVFCSLPVRTFAPRKSRSAYSVGGQLPGTFGESFHILFLHPPPVVSPHIGGKGHPASAVPAGKDISDPINIIKLVLHSSTPSLPSIPPSLFVDPGTARIHPRGPFFSTPRP